MARRQAASDTTAESTTPAEPEVHWLDPDERTVWLKLIALTSRLPGALDAQLQRDAGLTLFEYSVLAGLSEQPDRTIGMSRLAVLAQGSLSRLSHVASKLERKGLIRREPSPDDGRFTNAIITDEGVARVTEAAPQHVAMVRSVVMDQLTPTQLRRLRVAAETILIAIDPDETHPPADWQ